MSNPDIRNLRRAAARAAASREGLVAAIHAAKASGMSLRGIAEATDMSHEQVRRLLRAKS